MAIAFAVVFFTTMGLSTTVQADRTGTVGETINEVFDPGRERGEHASTIAPPTESEPSILDFVQNHKDQHDEDQHDDD